tara:strand:- start:5979 stop:6299 length:321 start_codon:yes stop_codon:yes gene_type:complete
LVSTNNADWGRETPRQFWGPSRKLLKSIRDYQRFKKNDRLLNVLLSKFCIIRHLFWSAVSGADIPLNSKISGIGANAVVTKDVGRYAIVAGVPAKVIGYNNTGERY